MKVNELLISFKEIISVLDKGVNWSNTIWILQTNTI